MALHFTDFEEYAIGAQPSDWTRQWTQVVPFTVVDNAGDKQLSWLADGSTGYDAITWDAVTPGTDFEIVSRTFVGDTDASRINHGICFYVTSAGGYYLRRNPANGTFALIAHNNSTDADTVLASTSPSNTAGLWVWIRAKVVGSSIKARIWTDGSAEQSTWDIDFTDATYTSGQCGIFGRDARSNDAYWSLFGVGTNGDSAPIDGSATNPAITITPADLPLIPGGTISGTYSNYATIPTTLTVSDGANTISSEGASPKITGLNIDDTAKTYTATVAALPEIAAFDAQTNYQVGASFYYDGVPYEVIATQSQPNATPPNATYYTVTSWPTANMILFTDNAIVELS